MSRSGSTTRDRAGRPAEPAVTRPRRTAAGGPRRRRRGRIRIPQRVRVVGALLVLAAATWAVWAGPLLAVRIVEVDGAGPLTAVQVREAAGIPDGTPLLRVDVAAAEARVARLPRVASVDVTRGWPRSVVITVVERVPVAVVDMAGRRSLVDAGGVPVDTVSGDPPPGVVPLTVPEAGPDDPATLAALQALSSLPEAVRTRVVEATATSGEDVTLTLDDGTTVLWGSAEEGRRKASALTALLDQLAAGTLDPAGTLDVSAPGAVVLR